MSVPVPFTGPLVSPETTKGLLTLPSPVVTPAPDAVGGYTCDGRHTHGTVPTGHIRYDAVDAWRTRGAQVGSGPIHWTEHM